MEQPKILFDLNEAQLLPLLEAAADGPIAGFFWEARPAEGRGHEDQSGDKQIAMFHYTTREGEAGKAILFAKRCVWQGRSEAVHYRHLAARGVPVARLYGTLHTARGEEIVFLERLTVIGFRADSESEWRAMLSLLARLNACEMTRDYAPHLYPYEQIGRVDGLWISGLDASPTDEQIEANLRACGVEEGELLALCRAAQSLFAQVAAQPQGLLHQDFAPDNVGWRGQREEIVAFDPSKCGLGPRFADVAPYLGMPDWSRNAAFLDTADAGGICRRESLTQHYLDEYVRSGGPPVSPATFREETTALSRAHKVTVLPWLVEGKQQTRIREVLEFLRKTSAGMP